MKNTRITALFMSVVMTISALQLSIFADKVFAAGEIGRLNGTPYYSFADLVDTLESDYKKGHVSIDMMNNWNAAGSDDFDRCLVIPTGCNATLNMHGYVFNRNRGFRSSSTSNGELIIMKSGSSLNIIGGTSESEQGREHPLVATYSSTDKNGKANRSITTYGGTLTGGCSTNGGGCITVKDECTLTLNSVTIAGCSSMDGTIWNGFGGGIFIQEDSSKVRLYHSTITGCLADQDGGGIYSNDDPTSIELYDSKIERNYASRNGGGIYVSDQDVTIRGTMGSSVINNESGNKGGGIYTCDTGISVMGLEISGNRSGSHGGGIYSEKEGSSFGNLVITNNTSSGDGGGIYVENDNTAISGCKITGNKANGSGGGVFVDSGVDVGFDVSGPTVVKDNKANGYGNQFHISDSSPESTRVNFSLTKGAEVWVSYQSLSDENYVMVTRGSTGDEIKSPNCIQYLHSSNVGWHFTFNDAPEQRKIYFVRDGHDSSYTGKPAPVAADPIDIKPQGAGSVIVGKVGPGGMSGSQYNLVRGYTRHEETDSGVNDTAVAFYYSDAFFDSDPKEYNPHLATASLNMAYAGMYLRAKETPASDGNYYYNRHASARQFMADIGCPDQNIYINSSNAAKPQTNSIGVTIASKELEYSDGTKTGKILIPVVIRGGGYELEWASNGTLDTAAATSDRGYEAAGFSKAADQVIEEIDKYIALYGLEDELAEGRVDFWISGYSRAGATANIVSKRIVEKYADGTDGKNNLVFGYTCEAPMGGTDSAEKLSDKTKYYCIHNLLNAVDIVPLVAPQLMGFKRYGVDHYIPGGDIKSSPVQTVINTSLRSDGGSPTATTYKDNDYTYIKNVSGSLKKSMQDQLRCVDSGIVIDDYFHPMAFVFSKWTFSAGIREVGSYDNNHIESFIRDFVRFLQEGTDPSSKTSFTQVVSTRTEYANRYQPALRDTLALVFNMDDNDTDSVITRASSVISKFNYILGSNSLLSILNDLLGWYSLPESDKLKRTTSLWEYVESTDAFDFLNEQELAKLKTNWYSLLDMAFTLFSADNKYTPGSDSNGHGWARGAGDNDIMLLTTFATFSGYILQNHYPEVNLAWARAYDSYYDNETSEFEVLYGSRAANAGYTVSSPSAVAVSTEEADAGTVDLVAGSEQTNNLQGEHKIILEVERISGEAIYYDLKDNDSGILLKSNEIYRGGVDLSLGTAINKNYTLTAYAISYGVRSEKAVYNINLKSDLHTVIVEHTPGYAPSRYIYREGNQVVINAMPGDSKYMTEWKVELYDGDGKMISDNIAEHLLGDQVKNNSATFTLPESGSFINGKDNETYPDLYSLFISAQCSDRIKTIVAWIDKPVAGEQLDESAQLHFDNTPSYDLRDYPISWSYEDVADSDGASVTATGTPESEAASPSDDPVLPDEASPSDEAAQPDEVSPSDEPSLPAENNVPAHAQQTEKANDKQLNATQTSDLKKDVPTSGEVYNETVYIATIKVPMSVADRIIFAPDITCHVNPDPQNPSGNVRSVSRNDANGSVVIEIEFEKTGDSGKVRPDTDVKLTINTVDINNKVIANKNQSDYYIRPDSTITLTAPEADDGVFRKWDFGDTGIKPSAGYDLSDSTISVDIPASVKYNELEITAVYTPVIKSIRAFIYGTEEQHYRNPTGGRALQTQPDADTLDIQFSEYFYDVKPENVKITWKPEAENGIADYKIPYTVEVALNPEYEDGNYYIYVKKPSEDAYSKILLDFEYSQSLIVTVNGEENAVLNRSNYSVSYTFPASRYVVDSIDMPGDIYNVSHGATESWVKEILPRTIPVHLNNGAVENVPVTWELTGHQTSDDREATYWYCKAIFHLPDEIWDEKGITIKPNANYLYVYVNEADYAKTPMASLDSGSFLADQTVFLSTEETDGAIYYALGNDEFRKYEGEEIRISREDSGHIVDNTIYLKAYTVKEGKWDSTTVTYGYTFSNEVSVPAGKELIYNGNEQTGIDGSAFYVITEVTEGGSVNSAGDAVATEAGTYSATVRINEGFVWKTDDDTTSSDDQVVTFTIKKAPVVYFDPGEGSGTMESVAVADGTYIVPDSAFTAPEGKVFTGWKTGDDSVLLHKGDSIKVSEDVTLVAQYSSSARLEGYSLSLDGDIGVNFYLELADSFAGSKTAYMQFTVEGMDPQIVPVSKAMTADVDGNTYHVFKCRVSAKNVRSTITAQLIDGSNTGDEYSYTVVEYADYLIRHAADNEQYSKALPIVKALINYATSAQAYFGVNTDAPANNILEPEERKIPEVSAQDIAKPFKPEWNNLPEDVTFEGASLSLKSETTLSLYFTSSHDLEFSCDQANLVVKEKSGKYQIARIRNVNIRNLGQEFTINVSSGSTTGTITYSALTYCYNVLNDSSYGDKHQNVCRTLYAFWLEAEKYYTGE